MQVADCCPRSLALLIRAVSPGLLRRLLRVIVSILCSVRRFQAGEVTPKATFHLETDIERHLRELGRVIMEWTLNHLEPADPGLLPPQLHWRGEYYSRRTPRSPLRRLACLFGPIRLSRYVYRPLEAAEHCLFPLELALGLVDGTTPALADHVGRLSADLTQKCVLRELSTRGITWGVGTLRKVQQSIASELAPFRQQAQADALLSWLKEASLGTGPRKPSLSVGRDGIMLPVLKNKKYREGATATLSVMNRHGQRQGTVYLGQMPEYGQAQLTRQMTDLLSEVLTRWSGPLPRLAYVSDAGHHPQEYFEQVLSGMRHPVTGQLLQWERIVDYYHACEYITSLAEAIFGKGRAASAWARKMRLILKTKPGGVFRVLHSAAALKHHRGLHSTESEYWTPYCYLRNHAAWMNYSAYRDQRLAIGSGITEAGCKILFTQRFKQSGMRWSIESGATILELRTIKLSGIWSEVRTAWLQSYIPPTTASPTRPNAQSTHFHRITAACS